MSGGLTSRRKIIRVVRPACLLILLMAVILETAGFPVPLKNRVLARMSRGSFCFESSGMRLDMLSGLCFSGVKIYRKQIIGPPAVECGGMRVRFNPFSKGSCISVVEFVDGSINIPQMMGGPSPEKLECEEIDVVLTRMSIGDIQINRFNSTFLADKEGVCVTNIVVSMGDGTVSGSVSSGYDKGTMAGRLVTNFDPHRLIGWLRSHQWGYSARLIERFSWGDEKPLVDTVFTLSDGEFTSRSLFSMEDYSYRGVYNDSSHGVFSVTYNSTCAVVNVENIAIGIGSGMIIGSFSYDSNSDLVDFRSFSDVDPKDFFQMLGVFSREEMRDWISKGRTSIASSGIYDLRDGLRTQLEASVDASGLGAGFVITEQCRFGLEMNGSVCRITNVTGRIWDGEFNADATLLFDREEKTRAKFSISVDDCDFAQVVTAVSGLSSNEMRGKFAMDISGEFEPGTNSLGSMQAAGRLSVDDGKVFQLPVFGGLTSIMTRVIPGLEFVIGQSDLNAGFTVGGGQIVSDNINIEGRVLSMKARGVTGLDGTLDYSVQLTLMSDHSVLARLLRTVTWPISKLMEFRLKGNRDDPRWYPVNFSADLLEKIGLKRDSQQ